MCRRVRSWNSLAHARRPSPAGIFKFTLTSPYTLARTLLDNHYGDFEALTMAIADVMAEQVADLPYACVQVDEANMVRWIKNW